MPEDATQPEQIKDGVTLRHPHTEETVHVENSAEALTPYMVRGFQQVKGEENAS